MKHTKQYAERDIQMLDEIGGHYCRHAFAMTKEGLHDKMDIAAELGYRDSVIEDLTDELEKAALHLCATFLSMSLDREIDIDEPQVTKLFERIPRGSGSVVGEIKATIKEYRDGFV